MNKDKFLIYGICLVIFVFCVYMFNSVSADVTYFNENIDCDMPYYTYVNEWTNYDNIKADDGSYAFTTVSPSLNELKTTDYSLRSYCYIYDYNLNISWINVSMEGYGSREGCVIQVKLSSDNGTTWSDAKNFIYSDSISIEYYNGSVSDWNLPVDWSDDDRFCGNCGNGVGNWAIYMTTTSGIGYMDYNQICISTNCSDNVIPLNDYGGGCRGDFVWKLVYCDLFEDNQTSFDGYDVILNFDGTPTYISDLCNSSYISGFYPWEYELLTYQPFIAGYWDLWTQNMKTGAFFIDVESDYIDNITSYRKGGICNDYFSGEDANVNVTNSYGDWFNSSFDWNYNSTTDVFNVISPTHDNSYLYDNNIVLIDYNDYGFIELDSDMVFSFTSSYGATVGTPTDWSILSFDDNYYNFTNIGCNFYLNHSWNSEYNSGVFTTDTHQEIDNITCDGGGCSYPWYYNFTDENLTVNITITGCGTATNLTEINDDNWINLAGLSLDSSLLAVILFALFFWFAERKEDFILYMVSGILALVMGVLYITDVQFSLAWWVGVIGVLLAVYCSYLALYYGLKNRGGRKD